MKSISCLFGLLGLIVADGKTYVSVLEFGKGGAVRRTSSEDSSTSVHGVASFWSKLHVNGRKLQHSGMTVVPDLFSKPDAGLVISLMGSGIDIDNMSLVNELVTEEGKNNVVGHFDIRGSQGNALLAQVGKSKVENVDDVSSLASTAKKHCHESGLSGLKVNVDNANVASVESQLTELMQSLTEMAMSSEKTIVVHLVVEEEEGSSRRRELSRQLTEDENVSRRLEDRDENNKDGDEDGDNNDGNNNGNGGSYSGYYGYGYYNAYGEWVTPYKSMFQIQYFNVVLWSALGLTLVLFYTISLMLNMPLMPDTLLFGESAKLVGEE